MISIILAFVVSSMLSGGSYMIVRSRSRKLTLQAFYAEHRMRNFDEVRVPVEVTSEFLGVVRRRLASWGGRLSQTRNMAGPIERIDAMCELAQVNTTGAIWIVQTMVAVVVSIPLAIFLMAITQVAPLLLLPVMVGAMLYTRLSRKARSRRTRIQQQLPSIMALMAAAAAELTSLDGARGIMNWICMTVDDDVTQLFHALQVKAVANRQPLEDVFEEAAIRLGIPEFSILAETFLLFHKAGRGLRDAFVNMATNWREEQARELEAAMARKTFMATVPLVLFDIPALLLILLTPAAFTIVHDIVG